MAERLADWPIFRTLVLNPLFGLIVLVIGGAVLAVLLALPKVWRTTPDGFRPIIRISLLDYAQAWSLRRTAERARTAGNIEEELRARFSAAANNPGNPALLREALQSYVRTADVQGLAPDRAANAAAMLLRLSPTNEADIHLAARTYDAVGYTGQVLGLLEPRRENLPEDLQGPLMKALFNTGRADELAEWWATSGQRLAEDPELALYHAAWLAGWGDPRNREPHLENLLTATESLEQRLLANQLLLAVCWQHRDLTGYANGLERLQGFRGDRLIDHVRYWLLLRDAGQSDLAARLARDHPYAPRNPMEATTLAQALVTLGQRAEARHLLEATSHTLGNTDALISLPFWALLGDLHLEDGNWDEVIRIGRQIQSQPGTRPTLGGFGSFIEGRGWQELGLQPAARQAFERAIDLGFPTPQLAMEIAILLLRLESPDLATDVLVPLEPLFENSSRYWQALFEAAYILRTDEALLFKAARRNLDLAPDDPVRQANYAVALLVTRQRPEEALRLTFSFVNAQPNLVLARLNHAHALAQTGRLEEAARIAGSLSPPADPGLRTSLGLLRFTLATARQDPDAAQRALEEINPDLLFPSQQDWIHETRRQLPALRPGATP